MAHRDARLALVLAALVASGLGCARGERGSGSRSSSSAAVASEGGARFEPAQTFAVIVGTLSFRDPSLTSFAARHRKDQELYDVLAARGVPRNQMTLLLDAQATRAAMLA